MVGVRVLMEPILSLHYVAEIPLSLRYTPLKRSILLTPLRSGLVPLAPVGLSWIGSCPNGSRRVLSPRQPETKMRNDGEYRNEEGTRFGSSF